MAKENIYFTNLVLSAGILTIGLLFKYDWCIYISLAIMILTAISDTMAKAIASMWLKIGEVLGKVNGKIILSIFFFAFLIPLGLLKKLLDKSNRSKSTSNWKKTQELPMRFDKPW